MFKTLGIVPSLKKHIYSQYYSACSILPMHLIFCNQKSPNKSFGLPINLQNIKIITPASLNNYLVMSTIARAARRASNKIRPNFALSLAVKHNTWVAPA